MSDRCENRIFKDDHSDTSRKITVVESLASGCVSSAVTTVLYQPLELLKTRIQLRGDLDTLTKKQKLLGRATISASKLIKNNGLFYLWRGTGASLLRSVPGVGIYYATLNVLQTSLSKQDHKPDSASQAFYFAITARSMVSLVMLPITVVKVRYESGQYRYSSLFGAVREAYSRRGSGWVGVAPTIFRDSLFSGVYYMCYTKLKSFNLTSYKDLMLVEKKSYTTDHTNNFLCGIISGLIASVITNPLDVLKTNIQVDTANNKTMRHTFSRLISEKNGYMRFSDGLVPRSLRRTLIAASTWTFYEFLMDLLR